MMLRSFLLLCCALIMTACAIPNLPDEEQCERLDRRLGYCLLAPEALGWQGERLDRVQIQSTEGRQAFIAQLRADESSLLLAAQSMTGMALFRLRWNGQQLDSTGRYPEEGPSAQQLLALIQLTLGDPAALNRHIYGGQVDTEVAGQRRLRLDNGRVILRIHFLGEDAPIRIEFAEDIQISLEPL